MWNTSKLVRGVCREVQKIHLLSASRSCVGLQRHHVGTAANGGINENLQDQGGGRRSDYSQGGSGRREWTWSNMNTPKWKWRAPIVSLAGALGEKHLYSFFVYSIFLHANSC